MRARVLVVLTALLATGCESQPPPLFPVVEPGDPCPVTPSRPGFEDAVRVIGDGPLYPVAGYFPDGVLKLRPEDRKPDGSYEKKVRWVGVGYAGPVLVRAARIDGPGTASATFSYVGRARDGGHFAELQGPDADLPATTTVSGPGCYAYRVDGTGFSDTIVFQAVA